MPVTLAPVYGHHGEPHVPPGSRPVDRRAVWSLFAYILEIYTVVLISYVTNRRWKEVVQIVSGNGRYPTYVKGNPQLRIFLPNFWMKLVKPDKPLPPNQVKFIIPLKMTEYDVKNYLEKIYRVPVVQVNTAVRQGNIRRALGKPYLVKEDDYRVAYVTLTHDFEFPDLYPEDKIRESVESMKKQNRELERTKHEYQKPDPMRRDVPPWFGI